MIYTASITGHVPAKKNGKHSYKGRVVIDAKARAEANWLTCQLRRWWGRKPALEAVSNIDIDFHVRSGRADLDGKYTTVQDCLVEAGVLVNDSIARVPEFGCCALVVKGDFEESVITITTPDEPARNGEKK